MEGTSESVSKTQVNEVLSYLRGKYEPLGFEFYPFKVGWYNDQVEKWFRIPYEYHNLAIIMISTPKMFEKSFVPFLLRNIGDTFARDPIDVCMKHYAREISEASQWDTKCIHDFDLLVRNKPSIVIQTAAHVAGAAFYYQRKDVGIDPWDKKQQINGVCIHPKYGGWFALRCVFIAKNITCPDLEYVLPQDVITDLESRKQLLQLYNFEWSNYKFRDIIPVVEKYSDLQKLYFSTKPEDRSQLLARIQCRDNDTGVG